MAGRKPYIPTPEDRDKVKTMAGLGIPDYDIAKVMGKSLPTMRKRYRNELDIGHIQSTTAVAQSLYRQATNKQKPNVVAAIFWLKCRAGWKDVNGGADDVGKKDERMAAAAVAGRGKFSRSPPPKLIVNNR